jgi:hypothetical protein
MGRLPDFTLPRSLWALCLWLAAAAATASATAVLPVVLEGVADTLMEDHFDTGDHFQVCAWWVREGVWHCVRGVVWVSARVPHGVRGSLRRISSEALIPRW